MYEAIFFVLGCVIGWLIGNNYKFTKRWVRRREGKKEEVTWYWSIERRKE